jgi:hypothetical protein
VQAWEPEEKVLTGKVTDPRLTRQLFEASEMMREYIIGAVSESQRWAVIKRDSKERKNTYLYA